MTRHTAGTAGVPPRGIAAMLAFIIGLNALSIDTYLPALPTIAASFGAELQLIEASVSTYLIGYAIGLLISAPVSDRIGRRPVIMVGMMVFLLSTIAILLSQSAAQLLGFRLLQAVGSGIALVNVTAIVRDFFDEHDSARVLATISMIMLVIPLVAPLLGVVLLQSFGWRSIFVALAAHALAIVAIVRFALPETVRRRPRSSSPIGTLAASFAAVLRHRRATAFALTAAFANACLFLYISDAAFVFIDYFAVEPTLFPYLFGANVIALIAMHRVNILLLRRMPPRAILPRGIALLLVGAFALCAYTLLFTPRLPHILALFIVTIGSLPLIVNNALAAYMSRFPDNAGMASALSGSLIFALSGVASWLLAALHDGHPRSLGAAMAVSTLAALLCSRIALAAEPARPQSAV